MLESVEHDKWTGTWTAAATTSAHYIRALSQDDKTLQVTTGALETNPASLGTDLIQTRDLNGVSEVSLLLATRVNTGASTNFSPKDIIVRGGVGGSGPWEQLVGGATPNSGSVRIHSGSNDLGWGRSSMQTNQWLQSGVNDGLWWTYACTFSVAVGASLAAGGGVGAWRRLGVLFPVTPSAALTMTADLEVYWLYK